MLKTLCKMYSELILVEADPARISGSWVWTGRERNAYLPRESKYAVDTRSPVVLVADHLYARLNCADKTCEKTHTLMDSLRGCYYSRGSSPCAHIGEELDTIVETWGVEPGKLLSAAIAAIEADITAFGREEVRRRIDGERECVQEFLRKAGADGEADKLGGTAYVPVAALLESVRAGEEAIDESFGPDLDERIKVAKAQLAELECQRDKRDTLKEMGKRVREDILPWNAASGVFKRAKTA